jgi:cell division protein FtsL
MDKKKVSLLLIVIAVCAFFYFFITGQINNRLVNLLIEKTTLEEEYAILQSESLSMQNEIESLSSYSSLNKVAEENNLKEPKKEQVIVLKDDKNKEN